MRFSDTLSTAFRGVTRNGMRTLLTTLGIIIGVGSVVLMVSIGRSFQGYVVDLVDSFGGNIVEVIPTGFEKFGQAIDTITYEDYLAVKKLSTVESVAPVIFVTETVSYGSEELSPYVFGTTKEFFTNYGQHVGNGRLLEDDDITGARSVAVVAAQTAEDLFGNQDPIGQRIKVGARFYTIVGVMEAAVSLVLQDMDTPVYIPFTTARSVTGQKHLSYISMRSIGDDELAQEDIRSLLRQRHSINNPEGDPAKDDFTVHSTEQATQIIGTVTLGLTAFLGLIAGISLVVGGIGVMNIMLVSVSERTKEIGLRKAVGARRQDILLQFMIEAVTLTLIGGTIGIIGGVGIGFVLAAIANKILGDFRFALSLPALLAAIIMAFAVGLIFGVYPAKKAASLSPMEAIRHE